MARLLTRAQYARKSGYSRARITQLVNQEVIKLKNGKIDPAQAEAAIAANIDRSRRIAAEKKGKAKKILKPSPQLDLLPNGKSEFNTDHPNGGNGGSHDGFNTEPSGGLPSLTDARRNRELVKIQKELLELKRMKAELVPKDEATRMVIALGTAAKLAFLNLPRRLAPALKTLTDEKEIEMLLRSEIREIIRTLEHSTKHRRPGGIHETQ